MRIALLEDDQQEKEEFISALQGWDPTRTAECYNSIEDLIAEARKEPYFTVAFLDVYLPKERYGRRQTDAVSISEDRNRVHDDQHFTCD